MRKIAIFIEIYRIKPGISKKIYTFVERNKPFLA